MKIINLFIISMLLVLITGCATSFEFETNEVLEENDQDADSFIPTKAEMKKMYLILNPNSSLTDIESTYNLLYTGLKDLRINPDNSIELDIHYNDNYYKKEKNSLHKVELVFDNYNCKIDKYLLNDKNFNIQDQYILEEEDKITFNFNCDNFNGDKNSLTGMIKLEFKDLNSNSNFNEQIVFFSEDKYILNEKSFFYNIDNLDVKDVDVEQYIKLGYEPLIGFQLVYSNDLESVSFLKSKNNDYLYEMIKEELYDLYTIKDSKGNIFIKEASDEGIYWFTTNEQVEFVGLNLDFEKDSLDSEILEIFLKEFPVNNDVYDKFDFQSYEEYKESNLNQEDEIEYEQEDESINVGMTLTIERLEGSDKVITYVSNDAKEAIEILELKIVKDGESLCSNVVNNDALAESVTEFKIDCSNNSLTANIAYDVVLITNIGVFSSTQIARQSNNGEEDQGSNLGKALKIERLEGTDQLTVYVANSGIEPIIVAEVKILKDNNYRCYNLTPKNAQPQSVTSFTINCNPNSLTPNLPYDVILNTNVGVFSSTQIARPSNNVGKTLTVQRLEGTDNPVIYISNDGQNLVEISEIIISKNGNKVCSQSSLKNAQPKSVSTFILDCEPNSLTYNSEYDVILITNIGVFSSTQIARKSSLNLDKVFVDCIDLPGSWILVPGNANLGTKDFCVMKYEAKFLDVNDKEQYYGGWKWDTAKGNMKIASLPKHEPINYITQDEAKKACNDLCEGCQLITNNQWTTIARNIEKQKENWNSSVVGLGSIYKGNYHSFLNNKLISSPLNTDDVYFDIIVQNNNTINYVNYLNAKRTLKLSNGGIIWDFAGNVGELNDNICDKTFWDALLWGSDNVWAEWTNDDPKFIDLSDYEKISAGPIGDYNSNFGVGKYKGCQKDGDVFIRGGNFQDQDRTGIFALEMKFPSYKYYDTGFRCAYIPQKVNVENKTDLEIIQVFTTGTEDGTISTGVDTINLVVRLGAKSSSIKLNDLFLQFYTNSGTKSLTYSGNKAFNTKTYSVDYKIKGSSYTSDYLNVGDLVEIKFILGSKFDIKPSQTTTLRLLNKDESLKTIQLTTPSAMTEKITYLYP